MHIACDKSIPLWINLSHVRFRDRTRTGEVLTDLHGGCLPHHPCNFLRILAFPRKRMGNSFGGFPLKFYHSLAAPKKRSEKLQPQHNLIPPKKKSHGFLGKSPKRGSCPSKQPPFCHPKTVESLDPWGTSGDAAAASALPELRSLRGVIISPVAASGSRIAIKPVDQSNSISIPTKFTIFHQSGSKMLVFVGGVDVEAA